MNPLIRGYRDYVTITPLDGELTAGDIVLFSGQDTERFVMHRVWEVNNGKVLIWGDNCPMPDGWFPLERVLGKVMLIERGGRKIRPEPHKGLRWANFMHKAGRCYRFYRRCKEATIRRIKILKVRG